MKRFLKAKNQGKLNLNQAGAASIYVSMFIMAILSLITLTFVRIVSNNLKQARENQYSLQAYYASESAINDVRATIHENIRATQAYGADTELTVKNTGGSPTTTHLTSLLLNSFGSALFASGDFLFIGSPNEDKVSIWEKDSPDDWRIANATELAIIEPPVGEGSGLEFGASVFVADGFLFIGAPKADNNFGAVYVFDTLNWANVGKIGGMTDAKLIASGKRFGAAVAYYDSVLYVGIPAENSVFRFSKDNNSWQLSGQPLSGGSGDFGAALSIHSKYLAVGAPAAAGGGKVYIYTYKDGSWSNNPAEIDEADVDNLASGDEFGSSVSLFGSLLVVGAPEGGSDDKGAVHILEKQGSSWVWRHNIAANPSDATTTDISSLNANYFGRGVALSDNILAVGAPNDIYFFNVQTNNILNDILASNLSQDCPSQEDAHPAWRNGVLAKDVEVSDDFTISDLGIEYLCVSVDVAPQELIYDRVNLDRSLLLHLQPVESEGHDDVNLDTLTIEWAHDDKNLSSYPQSGTDTPFPPASSWREQDIPLLRVQIIIVNTDQPYSRETLKANSRVFFLYPNNSTSNSVDWQSPSNDGTIIGGDCSSTQPKNLYCQSTFNLPVPTGGVQTADDNFDLDDQLTYLVRIQPIYNKARLVISGKIGGDSVKFKNIQAVITATGRSNNVTERIRERIPLRPVYDLPEYAIDSAGDLCKILVATDHTGVHLYNEDQYESLLNKAACSLVK